MEDHDKLLKIVTNQNVMPNKSATNNPTPDANRRTSGFSTS